MTFMLIHLQTAVTYDKYGANCWYWPNNGTGKEVALHNVIHGVEQLSCCKNTDDSCCTERYPNHCLCEDIVTSQDFLRCLSITTTTSTATTTTTITTTTTTTIATTITAETQ